MARKSIADDAEWKRLRKAEDAAWADWAVGSAEEAHRRYRAAVEACETYEKEWKP